MAIVMVRKFLPAAAILLLFPKFAAFGFTNRDVNLFCGVDRLMRLAARQLCIILRFWVIYAPRICRFNGAEIVHGIRIGTGRSH